ncbi:MAG: hypothetical protein GY868_14365, partial [Deltaproteobacteria bacterium]|nr:hypothetical protein [Deltaproteobacteria bacterium]
MKISDVRIKILSGYVFLILMLVSVITISLFQFTKTDTQVAYLTENVSAELRSADRIRSEILSMHIAVEKYLNKETDNDLKTAQRHFDTLQELLWEAHTHIRSPERRQKLREIED